MKAPDKIYLSVDKTEDWKYAMWTTKSPQEQKFSELDKHEEYIRKDALLEWVNDEMEKLWELLPDAHKVENETATPMEMRYLGQYMQLEVLEDKLNSM